MFKGKIQSLGKENLQKIIDNSNNYKEVLEKIGLSNIGNNYKTLKKYIEIFQINTKEIEQRKKETTNNKKYTKESFLKLLDTGNLTMKPSRILKKLIEYNLKEYKCEECGISKWNNKEITLELHHIDGNNKNNKLNNFKILCPNCHSQTENFRYKNKKQNNEKEHKNKNRKNIHKKIICPICNKNFMKDSSKTCRDCYLKSINSIQ